MNSSSRQKVISILKKHRRFTVGCHLRPDGDAIGSLLAMGLSLERIGKQVEMVLPEGEPQTFNFLPGFEQIRSTPTFEPEVVISVDCAERARLLLPPEVFVTEPILVNIDHHISNTYFGDLNIVLPEAAATGEIVYQLLCAGGFPLDDRIAMAIYTAVATDTGFFRFSNTTAETLSLAAQLVETYGISPSQIAERVYEEKSFESLRLLTEVLSTLQLSEDQRFSWMILSQEMLQRYPVDLEETENFVNYASSIRGVEIGLFFKEVKPQDIKVSWRSKATVDVSRLAAHFGGGGHARAAGCSLNGSMEAVTEEVLSFVQQYFQEKANAEKDVFV
ncbi:MAG: bifunctional oligoribonuclease/PAP phosphatase NrnA [Firmicutes bacterium]|nr:bifunctional oligoribonuclease/PAP phosphatase NrnA [Bacillota bacterium]